MGTAKVINGEMRKTDKWLGGENCQDIGASGGRKIAYEVWQEEVMDREERGGDNLKDPGVMEEQKDA